MAYGIHNLWGADGFLRQICVLAGLQNYQYSNVYLFFYVTTIQTVYGPNIKECF